MNQNNEQHQNKEGLAYMAGHRAARVSLRESLPTMIARSSTPEAEIQLFALIDHLLANPLAGAVGPIDWSKFPQPEFARATFEATQSVFSSPALGVIPTIDPIDPALFRNFLQARSKAVADAVAKEPQSSYSDLNSAIRNAN
jgi:hypothetical protein